MLGGEYPPCVYLLFLMKINYCFRERLLWMSTMVSNKEKTKEKEKIQGSLMITHNKPTKEISLDAEELKCNLP